MAFTDRLEKGRWYMVHCYDLTGIEKEFYLSCSLGVILNYVEFNLVTCWDLKGSLQEFNRNLKGI